MARIDPNAAADKWARRLKAATPDIRTGIQNVATAPGVAAARQSALMLQKVTDAVSSGKWGRNVSAVTLEDWKAKAAGKGVDRISAGVDGATSKQQAMFAKLLPAVDAAVAAANKTPRGSLQDNITRMTTFVTEMAKRPIK